MEWDADAVSRCEAMILRRSKEGNGGCRLWTGATVSEGIYGRAQFAKIQTTAHRISYMCQMRVTKLDRTVQVRHLCGNSLCVNPQHLTTGTVSENEADKIQHGTSNHGKGGKITVEIARAIKNSDKQGSMKDRAVKFGVSRSTVKDIETGRTWAWLGKTEADDNKSVLTDSTKKRRQLKRKATEPFTEEELKRARAFILARVTNPRSKKLCAIWKQAAGSDGYGRAYFTRQSSSNYYSAHRLSYIAFNNVASIPAESMVRHMCTGNRTCVNPLHLQLGTGKENAADRSRDGTQIRGAASCFATITEETALAILKSRGKGTAQERADRFGTTVPIVRRIDYRITWKHLRA